MIDYSLILSKKYPKKQWALNGNDYDGLDWHDESSKPTKQELDNLWAEIEFEITKTAYVSQRVMAYPSFADQFDTIFHDGLDVWKAQIQAVKDKYPKSK